MKGNSQSDILVLLVRFALLRSGEEIGDRFSLSAFVVWGGGVAMASILARRSASPEAWVRSNDSNFESSVVWSACWDLLSVVMSAVSFLLLVSILVVISVNFWFVES